MKKLVASNPSGDVYTPLGNRIADRILEVDNFENVAYVCCCLLYTSPSPRDDELSRMPSSA